MVWKQKLPCRRGIPKRTRKQSAYLTCTAGHDPRLIDWTLSEVDLKKTELPTAPPEERATIRNNLLHSAARRWFWINSNEREPNQPQFYRSVAYELKRPPEKKNQTDQANGYWVISIPRKILDGHGGKAEDNGIFNSQMRTLASGIFGLTRKGNYRAPSNEKAPQSTSQKNDLTNSQPPQISAAAVQLNKKFDNAIDRTIGKHD